MDVKKLKLKYKKTLKTSKTWQKIMFTVCSRAFWPICSYWRVTVDICYSIVTPRRTSIYRTMVRSRLTGAACVNNNYVTFELLKLWSWHDRRHIFRSCILLCSSRRLTFLPATIMIVQPSLFWIFLVRFHPAFLHIVLQTGYRVIYFISETAKLTDFITLLYRLSNGIRE